MGVDFACRAVCTKFLTAEIAHRKATRPFDEIDPYGDPLTSGLQSDTPPEVLYLHPRHSDYFNWNSGRTLREIDEITRHLHALAHLSDADVSIEAKCSIERLYQFVGPFMVGFIPRDGLYNEFGLRFNTLLSEAPIRLHLAMFRAINWELILPLYEKHARPDQKNDPRGFYTAARLKETLTFYADVLDQAAEAAPQGRMLYIFAT